MIRSIEDALTYLTRDMERERSSLTTAKHRIVRQARQILLISAQVNVGFSAFFPS